MPHRSDGSAACLCSPPICGSRILGLNTPHLGRDSLRCQCIRVQHSDDRQPPWVSLGAADQVGLIIAVDRVVRNQYLEGVDRGVLYREH